MDDFRIVTASSLVTHYCLRSLITTRYLLVRRPRCNFENLKTLEDFRKVQEKQELIFVDKLAS